MAKLIIFHGDMLDREIDLGEQTARIGRGDDNEIVLTDPTKSVSRLHAELHFDQGKYSVVDLKSQNGVWVAGRRVPKAALEPGIPVVLGSYKLVLKKEEQPATSEATVLFSRVEDPSAAATILLTRPPAAGAKVAGAPPAPIPGPAAPAAAAPKPAPPAESAKPAGTPEVRPEPKPTPPPVVAAPAAVPKPEPVPAPKPVPPPPTPAPKPTPPPPPVPPPAPAAAAKPAAEAKPGGTRPSRTLMFAGLAILLAAGTAAVVFLTPLRNQLSGLIGSKPVDTTASTPPATPPPVVTPPAPSVPSPSATPAAATKAGRGSAKPPTGKPSATAVTPAAPTPDVVAPPPAPLTPAAPPPLPDPVVAPPLPDLTGLFEEARAAMIKGDYLAAVTGFKAVLSRDPNFPNASNLLGVAQGGAKNASQLAVDSGNKAEMGGDYLGAKKQYERALQLDPQSTAAPSAMRRLEARMLSEGEDTFKAARQYDALGRAKEAIAKYERALQLLPANNDDAKIARDRLAVLNKGGM